jgi:glycosyltransferase involved in cell wall biosynthesis
VETFIPISRSVQAFWEKRGLDRKKMVIVHNGIEEPSPIPVRIRESMGIQNPGIRLLGAVGTYNRQRGYEFLLRSLSLLKERNPHFRLLLIGNGNRRNLKALVDELSLQPYVYFMEHVERAVDYIAELDCLIIPYEVEPFGRVLLEAWMVKTPVILTDADYIRDLVVEGSSCALVRHGDAEALAETVGSLLGDEQRMREMQDFAYALVKERYGVSQYVDGVQRVYERVWN